MYAASWYEARRNGDMHHVRMLPFASQRAAEAAIEAAGRHPNFLMRDRVENLNPASGGSRKGHR